jgi:tRNA U34 5-carboxymethylaminomethyl modifying enzyme MnmG/GidA
MSVRAAHYENLKLPQDLDYMQVSALSFEARQRLNRHKPETLGQASRLVWHHACNHLVAADPSQEIQTQRLCE